MSEGSAAGGYMRYLCWKSTSSQSHPFESILLRWISAYVYDTPHIILGESKYEREETGDPHKPSPEKN